MKNKKVFLAEDDVIIQMDLNNILVEDGFKNISVFNDGNSLAEAALTQPPDLIIADIKLAHKTNGLNSAQIIWDKLQIPILFISALDMSKYKQLYANQNCSFISKPYKSSEVLNKVYSLLGNNS